MSKKKSLKEKEKKQDIFPGYDPVNDPIISHDSEPVPYIPPKKEKLILDKGLISQEKKKVRKKLRKTK